MLATLDVLMHHRKPLELSNEVTLVRNVPVDGGAFGHVRLGRFKGELVSIIP
jgi:hypothetical protein